MATSSTVRYPAARLLSHPPHPSPLQSNERPREALRPALSTILLNEPHANLSHSTTCLAELTASYLQYQITFPRIYPNSSV